MGAPKIRAPMVRPRPRFPKKTLRQRQNAPVEEADGRRRFQIILKKTPPKKTPSSNRLVYRTFRSAMTPVEYAHHPVAVKGYVDRVVICCRQKTIAEHGRCWEN